jgi:copper chaperone CopZ
MLWQHTALPVLSCSDVSSLPLLSHSDGCANAVKRVLGKIDGVKNIQTNVEAKTVVVEADESVSPQFMLEKLQKVRRCCHDTYATRLV